MPNTDPLEWRLLNTDFATDLGILPSDGGNLYVELNEAGSGELKIPATSAIASLVTVGMFAQCNYRGAARGGFLIDNLDLVNASSEEGAGQWLSLSGRGALAILDEAIIWDDGSGNTTREFTGTKASILITLIDEAVTRGACANVIYDFTALLDSESNSWTDSEKLSLNVGTSLLEVVRQFSDVGIDFDMVVQADGDFLLKAFVNEKGSNLSSSVYFRVGTNCQEVKQTKLGTKINNVLKLKWRDGFANVQDNTSISSYRRREKILNIEAAQSASSAVTYGAAKLDGTKDPQRSLPIKLYDGVTPYAFVSYNTGDYITIDRFGVQASERIRGMQLSFDEGFAVVTITLNDTIVENEIDMSRDLDWLMNQWNTARDAKLFEVQYWAAIGDPSITYDFYGMIIAGSKLYVIDGSNSLLIYNIDIGGWTRVDLSSVITTVPTAICAVGSDIYIGSPFEVAKYSGGTLTNIGAVVDAGTPEIRSMVTMGTNIYCAGVYDTIDGVAISGLAKYNTLTDTWTDVGGATGFYTMATDGSNLYGGVQGHLWKWDGISTWTDLSFVSGTGWIYALAIYGTSVLAGSNATGGVFEWDGATWSTFGGGVTGTVKALAVYLTDVFVGGDFTDVGNYVAKYSGGSWWALEQGTNDEVKYLQLYDSDLYVAGDFTTAGDKTANNIAVYFQNFEAMANYLEHSSGTFNLGEAIHNATAKTPLVAADEMPLWDSVSKQLRKITWANMLVTIGTWADALYVKLTGNQTIAGVKTFSSFPVTPSSAPTTDYQVANKKYVDDSGGGGGSPAGSDGQIQYNDSGAFGASDELVVNVATGKVLYLGETATSSGVPSQLFNFDPTASAGHVLNTWGSGFASFFKGVFARGTKASPTAVQSADVLVRYRGAGYDGVTGVGGATTNGEIRVVANENFDATHHGADVEIHATPAASTTLTKILSILGSGNVNIATGKEYQVNGAQHTHAASNITSGTLDTARLGSGTFVLYDNELSVAASSFDISSIAADYAYLKLIYYLRQSSTTVDCPMVFNNDTGANYNFLKVVIASGGVTPTDYISNNNILFANAVSTDDANFFSSGEVTIQNYAKTVGYKNLQIFSSRPISNSAGLQRLYNYHGIWKSTAAINRITITAGAGNFIAGSRITLVGVR